MAIIEEFKKGQLVPKRLGILDTHKKNRGCVVFGSDVIVTMYPNNPTVYIKSDPEYPAMLVKRHHNKIKRKNGTFQKKGISLKFQSIVVNIDPRAYLKPHINTGESK